MKLELQEAWDKCSWVAPEGHPIAVDPVEYSDIELLYAWSEVVKHPDKQHQGVTRALALGVIRTELGKRGYDLRGKTCRELLTQASPIRG
jgi:hypothetical protein